MKKQLLFFALLFTGWRFVAAQEAPLIPPARVIFYNVENLFDTINDPAKHDEEFLPAADKAWNSEKYELKIRHITKVISTLLDTIPPFIIGLAEVENEKVLQDLVAQPELQKYNLGIVHHESPDERGIDVALLYNPEIISEVFHTFLRVDLGKDKTRDILYFKAYVDEGAPLWVFVNHWTSRYGSSETSEGKRLKEAAVLRAKIDDVLLGEPLSKIIVMGDLNDNPTDSAPTLLAQSARKDYSLINLAKPLAQQGKFTLKYKGAKELFDQFLVSKNLMSSSSSFYVRHSRAYVFAPKWLLYKHTKDGYLPNRTYVGNKWVGGYSDHLPVYFDLIFQ